jgi:hypothetical protein
MPRRQKKKQPKRRIMKTVFLFAALIWASATTKTFANDVHVNRIVLQSFKSTFGHASVVKWSVVDNLYKAEFNVDGEATTAFFDPQDGSMIACSRYLTIDELPRTLQRSLKKAAESNLVTEVFEVQSDAGIDYFASVKKPEGTVILKAASTTWNVYKKG